MQELPTQNFGLLLANLGDCLPDLIEIYDECTGAEVRPRWRAEQRLAYALEALNDTRMMELRLGYPGNRHAKFKLHRVRENVLRVDLDTNDDEILIGYPPASLELIATFRRRVDEYLVGKGIAVRLELGS